MTIPRWHDMHSNLMTMVISQESPVASCAALWMCEVPPTATVCACVCVCGCSVLRPCPSFTHNCLWSHTNNKPTSHCHNKNKPRHMLKLLDSSNEPQWTVCWLVCQQRVTCIIRLLWRYGKVHMRANVLFTVLNIGKQPALRWGRYWITMLV